MALNLIYYYLETVFEQVRKAEHSWQSALGHPQFEPVASVVSLLLVTGRTLHSI